MSLLFYRVSISQARILCVELYSMYMYFNKKMTQASWPSYTVRTVFKVTLDNEDMFWEIG